MIFDDEGTRFAHSACGVRRTSTSEQWEDSMGKYLRFVNPLVAVVGLGLCIHGGIAFVQDEGDRLPWSIYLLAKGLFGGLGLLVLGVTANRILGCQEPTRGIRAVLERGMKCYLRWLNPLAACLIVGLCVYCCQAVSDTDDGVVLGVYFLAKGLFCGLALFLSGVIADRVLSKRVGQGKCTQGLALLLTYGPPLVALAVLSLCTFTFVGWIEAAGKGDVPLPVFWCHYFLGSGLFCSGTLLLLGWLASYACGLRSAGTNTPRFRRTYLRWGIPLLSVVTLLLCTYASTLWISTPDRWMWPWLYFQARGLLNGACLLALGVITERVLLHSSLTTPDSGEKEVTE